MGFLSRKKNITYWFNYCKKYNIDTLYLVLHTNVISVDELQQYRIKYHPDLEGYALEVFAEDRFVFAFYTTAWDNSIYFEMQLENITEKEKFILKNGQWVDKESLSPEPLDYSKEMIKRDLISRDDTGKILYYDFTNDDNKLQ